MIIRQEARSEFGEIYELVKVAFQTAQRSNGKEQDFVNELRSGANYIPQLALVCEENGKLIGHIMLTRTLLTGSDGDLEALYLAPISVVFEHRNKGIGSAMIKESFKIAREMGYKAVLLVGDPGYYHRFGFKPTVSFGIIQTHGIPDENVMACELESNALKPANGKVFNL